MSSIRPYSEHDWPQIWGILEPIFRAAETYAVSKDISEQEAKRIWVSGPAATFVIVNEDDYVAGSYYIKPNQPGPGSHVCNCGYVVSSESQGKGLASQMCIHSQDIAVSMGFKAMQFNMVVSTNLKAVHLWEKHNFKIVGTIPKAFQHPREGLVDGFIMYKELLSIV